MRSAALTLVFLTSAASAVSAAPGPDETTGRVRYKEKHDKEKRDKAPAPPRLDPAPADAAANGWIELASATPASHGREFILVGAAAGTFTGLRLTASSGRPGISSVRVDYADGSRRTFEIGKALARRRPIYVDLRGARELRQIIVVSDRASPGSYVLEANTGEAGVASR
jgi:hypothetical protein